MQMQETLPGFRHLRIIHKEGKMNKLPKKLTAVVSAAAAALSAEL